MILKFTRTGGFAPIPIGCTIDTAKLSPQEATEFEQLLAQSSILETPGSEAKGARDVHYYEFHIEKNGQSKDVRFDQLTIPHQARPLIHYLVQRSGPIKQ